MNVGTATGHFGVTTRITRVGFADGWTGALAIGTLGYVLAAIFLTVADLPPSPGLTSTASSDQPAAFAAALLAIVAARQAQQQSARKTWKFIAAAIVTYNVGNLIDAYLRIADLTPFPSLADLFYLAFFPILFTGFTVAVRASSLRASWGRLLLDSLILVLGFGTFFWFFVISPAAAASEEELARFVLAQVYIACDCVMLMAIGVLLMNSSHCPLRRMTLALLTGGFGMMFLGDIVWATAVVENSYFSGANFSDVLYLACYAGLAGAAQVQIRDQSRPERQRAAAGGALNQGVAYAGLGLSFFVLVYFAGGDGKDTLTIMTVAIFVLAVLVMARQSVILRDDAKERQRKAVDLVEARFASLIRNASDAIMIVSADGRIEYASPAMQRTFGLWHEDLVGRRLGEIWREADRERIAAFLAEVKAAQGSSIGPVDLYVGTKNKRFIAECVGSNLLDDPAVKGLALNLRDVTERKALEDQLRQLAFHDPLTLLANRSLFRNRVEHAIALSRRTQDRLAVLMIDLDNFKNVNDTLGHDVGDRLLQTAAQRLVKCTRSADTVARLGGDEFAVLLEGVSTLEQAEQIAAAVTEAFRLPLLIDGNELLVTTSVGVALSESGHDTEQLLRNADIAMYNAKSSGKGRHVVFHTRMQEQLRERLRLEDDLNQALVRKEFFLEFQPIIDLKTDRASRRRGAGAVATPGTGSPDARPVHPDGGGDRPDHRPRALGADGRLLPGAGMAQVGRGGQGPAGRSEHFRPPPAAGRPGRGRPRRARDIGPRAREPAHRADREHDDAQLRGQPREAPRAQGAWRPPRDRRFRHRLLVALVSASLPDRHPEDRPLVHQPADRVGRGTEARARGRHAGRDARPRDGRRGRRDRRPGGPAPAARLRGRAGLPVLARDLARRGRGIQLRAQARTTARSAHGLRHADGDRPLPGCRHGPAAR